MHGVLSVTAKLSFRLTVHLCTFDILNILYKNQLAIQLLLGNNIKMHICQPATWTNYL
jgi:hypothetical protein